MKTSTGSEILVVANKFDHIGHDDDWEFELDTETVISAPEPGIVAKDAGEANVSEKPVTYAEVVKLEENNGEAETTLISTPEAPAQNGTKEDESVFGGVVSEEDNAEEIGNKIRVVATEEAEEILNNEGDSIVLDSSVVDSVDADINITEPGIVFVGVTKEVGIKKNDADDEVGRSIPNIEEPDDMTAAYDGNFELAAKETSDAARVEHEEPKVDVGEELPVSERLNVGSVDVKEDPKLADESQTEANSNSEARELSEKDNAEEGRN
ncbi:unnamed protein product [Cochlearia groenlandica]